jgi:ankyrin repeat protein
LLAVNRGYLTISTFLIKHGADVEERDNRHLNPLRIAASRGEG